jgi:hypothetical protein
VARTFPRFKDGDELAPWHLNYIFGELERWRKFRAAMPLVVKGADSDDPPSLEFWGGGRAMYVAIPPSGGISAGTQPPSGSPGSATCAIYRLNASGGYASIGNFTVYNCYTAAVVATLICTVEPDGFGNYVVLAQSCS